MIYPLPVPLFWPSPESTSSLKWSYASNKCFQQRHAQNSKHAHKNDSVPKMTSKYFGDFASSRRKCERIYFWCSLLLVQVWVLTYKLSVWNLIKSNWGLTILMAKSFCLPAFIPATFSPMKASLSACKKNPLIITLLKRSGTKTWCSSSLHPLPSSKKIFYNQIRRFSLRSHPGL